MSNGRSPKDDCVEKGMLVFGDIESYFDLYMQANGPLHIMTFVGVLFIQRATYARRADSWWFILFLLSVPVLLSTWVAYFPVVGFGLAATCLWFFIWYVAFSAPMKRATGYNSDVHKQRGTAIIWWTCYTALFACAFCVIVIFSSAQVRPHMANLLAAIIPGVGFFGIILLIGKIRPLANAVIIRNGDIEQPYRIPCKDINNLTAYELVNSFDHPGAQMTAAVDTLQSENLRHLDEILAIEENTLSRLSAWARVIKIAVALGGTVLLVIVMAGGQPAYLNCVLLIFLVALVALNLLVWGPQFQFIPYVEHADAIAALSYIPSSKVIPALIRGWTTYLAPGFRHHADRISRELLRRLKLQDSKEIVPLDHITGGKLSARLWQLYRFAAQGNGAHIDVAVQLIAMPGMMDNEKTLRLLTKLSQKDSDDPAKAALEAAARMALAVGNIRGNDSMTV